ncbi:Thiazole synthase [Trichinella spiralis]|uniref:Thiazole synthase n=1 Tax=Trichinella spiralis TaxID=6334 RepID=A0ABR3K4S5_TRISP
MAPSKAGKRNGQVKLARQKRATGCAAVVVVVVVCLIRYLKMLPNEEKHRSSNEKTFCQTSKTKPFATTCSKE